MNYFASKTVPNDQRRIEESDRVVLYVWIPIALTALAYFLITCAPTMFAMSVNNMFRAWLETM